MSGVRGGTGGVFGAIVLALGGEGIMTRRGFFKLLFAAVLGVFGVKSTPGPSGVESRKIWKHTTGETTAYWAAPNGKFYRLKKTSTGWVYDFHF